MADSRRRDAATAAVGAGAVAASGKMREVAIRRAVPVGPLPKVHGSAFLRTKAGRKLFVAGHGLQLVGAAPLAYGAVGLARGRSDELAKSDRKPLWREGLEGTGDALRGRGESLRTKQPHDVRATQLGVGAAAGGATSVATRLALRAKGKGHLSSVISPVAGVLGATSSLPVSNRLIQRKHPDYVVTATGVKRRKTDPVMPSRKTFRSTAAPRQLRDDIRKADNYRGAKTSYRAQRAAITGAGATPLVGSLAASRTAGAFAPPGQERRTAVRQFAMGPVAGGAAGVAGAYGAAHAANHSQRFGEMAEEGMRLKTAATNRVRRAVGLKDAKPISEASWRGRALASLKAKPSAKPFTTPKGAAAGALGFLAAKTVVGNAGGQTAISMSRREQQAYNARHGITKADSTPTTGVQARALANAKQAKRKRRQATISTASGLTSIAAIGALAHRQERLANRIGLYGGAIGGTGALYGARVARGDARNLEQPVRKGWKQVPVLDHVRTEPTKGLVIARGLAKDPKHKMVAHGRPMWRIHNDSLHGGRWVGKSLPTYAVHASFGKVRVLHQHSTDHFMVLTNRDEKRLLHRSTLTFTNRVSKGHPGLAITGTPEEHKRLVAAYGDRGPLPKGLDRDTKMKAYEARYVHAGGDKSEKWNRRANVAEGSRNAALAAGTAGLAGMAALKHPKAAARMAHRPRLAHRLDATTLTAGAAGGASELYGEYARHRRASYANSPGGVARSALTRMRAYTPAAQED